MATPAQRTNTWILDEWYDQAVAGTQGDYSGVKGLWAWGTRNYGVLADNKGSGPDVTTPLEIPGTTWATLANHGASGSNQGAVRSDGTLWIWGANSVGVLGQNQIDSGLDGASSPIQIGTGTDWSTFALGYGQNTALATKTDGTLWVWGRNRHGELGQNQGQSNNNNSYSSPTQMGTGTDWATGEGKIAGVNMSQFAIKTDGSLWSWGYNAGGYLGQNELTSRSSPVQISGTWSTLMKGGYASQAAINTDGELFTWGYNRYGQLGNNLGHGSATGSLSSPTQIPGTWSAVANSMENMIATKTDGTIWGWGDNGQSELGQNETTQRSSPTQVPGSWATGFPKIGSNGNCSTAIKTDGTFWSWGKNESGQLGQGNTTSYSSPVQVGTDTSWDALSHGGNYLLAMTNT